jgi:hypothetical protein
MGGENNGHAGPVHDHAPAVALFASVSGSWYARSVANALVRGNSCSASASLSDDSSLVGASGREAILSSSGQPLGSVAAIGAS